MQLVDTHVHINFDVFQPDLEAVARRWRESGVCRLVHSCVEPSEFVQIRTLAYQFPEVFFAVGLHPLDADQWTSDFYQEVLALAQNELSQPNHRLVAIGETGLDYFKATNYKQQEIAFTEQLILAQELNLPVIIHCRDAAAPMAQLLKSFAQTQGIQQFRGVMHCWGGNPEETNWFIDLGFHISFSGTVTFKNAMQIQESARLVPSDRLLVETDCPFLAPVPKRGERRNEPAYVKYVAEQLARLRNVPLEVLASQTTQNAITLFRLPTLECGI